MNEYFDAVVIGSGFGGSVMAYRLAEAGLGVCLLERGNIYPPNSFPRSPFRMKSNFWDPSSGLYGMFNVWSFNGFGALISSGLGGGSLIYANVLIRKDEKWFVKEDLQNGGYEYWPVCYQDLVKHYERVEKMMNVQKYPLNEPPYNETHKTLAMREAAQKLKSDPKYGNDYSNGLEWELPNLAVTFANPGQKPVPGEPIKELPGHENLHGRTRYTCRLCGECDIGCNYGSKNTLDYNYLSEAKRLKAEIRHLCEVKSFEPRQGGGYTINYVIHKPDSDSAEEKRTVDCKKLILSAGALGSPYLLLKNRSAFPRISKKLGSRFSVNGDFLSFIVKSREIKDGEYVPRLLDPNYGPVITSFIRMRDTVDGGKGRGFYIEDGGYPAFLSWLLEAGELPGFVERSLRFGKRYIWGLFGLNNDADLGKEFSNLLGPAVFTSSSIPMLGMGRDTPGGDMQLRGKYLDVDWNSEKSSEYFERIRGVMKDIADSLNADYQDNLSWYLSQVLTAHPLGGCPMGRDENEGVVDSYGEVFNYPGLFIADGSVLPGPVGANPSLTIAALSDRFAERVAGIV